MRRPGARGGSLAPGRVIADSAIGTLVRMLCKPAGEEAGETRLPQRPQSSPTGSCDSNASSFARSGTEVLSVRVIGVGVISGNSSELDDLRQARLHPRPQLRQQPLTGPRLNRRGLAKSNGISQGVGE
jgi:hypothetical protein